MKKNPNKNIFRKTAKSTRNPGTSQGNGEKAPRGRGTRTGNWTKVESADECYFVQRTLKSSSNLFQCNDILFTTNETRSETTPVAPLSTWCVFHEVFYLHFYFTKMAAKAIIS